MSQKDYLSLRKVLFWIVFLISIYLGSQSATSVSYNYYCSNHQFQAAFNASNLKQLFQDFSIFSY